MNTKSLTHAAALLALVFLASNALADGPRPPVPSQPSSSGQSVPWHVHVPRSSHNGVSVDYQVDPQYHTATFRTVTHDKQPTSEPDRIYNLEKEQFVDNPDYHDPVNTRVTTATNPRMTQAVASKPAAHRTAKRPVVRQPAA